MNSLNKDLSHDRQTLFSHIYIERSVLDHPRTEKILSKVLPEYHFSLLRQRYTSEGDPELSGDQQIDPDHEIRLSLINNYKDVFYQKDNIHDRSLILSGATDKRVFPGSPVCQDFDEKYFYYASSAKNCLYDCEYCYLKGMYPSSHIVIDVDLTSVFNEVRELLREHPVYLCISYDTDLLALESLTGSVQEWMDLASNEKDLLIECRTKCARTDLWDIFKPNKSFIFAFTISPQEIITGYEHLTPSLNARINSIQRAMAAGHPVRLCFDPMIYIKDWENCYGAMIDTLGDAIDWSGIRDVSIGSFRISSSYLKKMRELLPESTAVQFPFELENGVYQYPKYLREKMQSFMINKLSKYIPGNKIFVI